MSTKKTLLSFLSLLLVCAMLLCCSACGGNPTEEFKDMEKDALASVIDEVEERLQAADSTASQAMETTVSFEVSNAILALLSSSLGGVDCSWVNDLELKYNIVSNEDMSKIALGLAHKSIPLLSGEILMGLAEDSAYLSVPQLTKKYLEVPLESGTSAVSTAQVFDLIKSALPLIETYYTMLLDGITDVQKTNGAIEANGVSQDCTLYTMTLTEKQAIAIVKNIATAMSTDENLKELFIDLFSLVPSPDVDPEDMYNDFLEEINGLIENINETSLAEDADESANEVILSMVSYVKKDDVLGRKLEIVLNDEGEKAEIFWGTAESKGEKGFALTVSENGDPLLTALSHQSDADGKSNFTLTASEDGAALFVVSGEFTEVEDLLSGTIEVNSEEETYLYVTVSDVNTKKLEEGILNGSFSLAPGEALLDLILEGAEDAGAALANLSLSALNVKFEISSTGTDSAVTVSILNGNANVLSATITGKVIDGAEITLPDESQTASPEVWASTLDFNAFLTYLAEETQLPDEIVAMLQLLLLGGIA